MDGGVLRACMGDVTLRMQIACPSDHGFVLYVGFDRPVSIEPVKFGELNADGGTLRIPIHFVD